MRVLRWAVVVALLLIPASARAQVIFAMDGTGGFTTSTFNFDSFITHALVTLTREAGTCPSGGASARIVIAQSGSHSQPHWGHSKALTDSPAQGATRYFRERIRYNGSTDFHGNSGPWYTKRVIIGNDIVGGGGRVIIWTGVGSVDDTTPTYWISKNVGTKAASNLSVVNGWDNVQVRLRSSSSAGVSDGRVDYWLNAANTSESTPTASVTGLDIDLTGANSWTNPTMVIGGEVDQTTLQTGVGHVDFNMCDVQYAQSFDTTWNSPGATAPSVSSVSPSSGSSLGGTSITITGTNYVATPTVTVGGVACTSPHFTSSTQIECTTGAHGVGAVDVTVTNPDTSTGTGTNAYTYTTPPAVAYRMRFHAERLVMAFGLFGSVLFLGGKIRRRKG